MNELDYVRDNRLRLWFIDRTLPALRDYKKRKRAEEFTALIAAVFTRLCPRLRSGGHFVLILGEATRGTPLHTAEVADTLLRGPLSSLGMTGIARYDDIIPDIRRSRRQMRGTKSETILVYRKVAA
jgi:hypothetical protein